MAQNRVGTYGAVIQHITERVAFYEGQYAISRGQAFMLWYAVEGLEMDEGDALAATDMDGGNDKGIDLAFIDDENEVIVIAQGKFHRSGNYNPRAGTLYELIHTTDYLQNPETLRRAGRPDLAEFAVDFNAAVAKGYTISFELVYMGPANQDVIDASSLYNNDPETPLGRSARVVDLNLLQQIHDEYISAETRIPEATVTIKPNGGLEEAGNYGSALVTTITGDELKRLYEDHGEALFDRNVRLFLGARKGSVNAGIRETLNTPAERQNFWAYNNGITFVCESFSYDPDKGQLTFRKFSIVNGCQTTVSIASSPDPVPSEVSVLARFIAVPVSQVVDSIIKYNNSQTKIRDWDLSSQDKNQKRLKNRLAEAPHPFFYQLRRGEWSHLKEDQRQPFMKNGKAQIIEPDILAQRLAAFKGMPVSAYKDKSSLFTSLGRTVFPSDLRIEEVLLAWLAGEAADEAVKNAIIAAKQNDQRDHARILMRGGKTFVLAVMAYILEARNGPNYAAKIKAEVAGSNNTRRDLAIYATVALTYYVEIMEDRIEAGNDLSQIVRSDDQFKRIQARAGSKWQRESLGKPFIDAIPKLA